MTKDAHGVFRTTPTAGSVSDSERGAERPASSSEAAGSGATEASGMRAANVVSREQQRGRPEGGHGRANGDWREP